MDRLRYVKQGLVQLDRRLRMDRLRSSTQAATQRQQLPCSPTAVVNTAHYYTTKCPTNAFSLNLIVICI